MTLDPDFKLRPVAADLALIPYRGVVQELLNAQAQLKPNGGPVDGYHSDLNHSPQELHHGTDGLHQETVY